MTRKIERRRTDPIALSPAYWWTKRPTNRSRYKGSRFLKEEEVVNGDKRE